MTQIIKRLSRAILLVVMVILLCTSGQAQTIDFTFDTKDYDGNVLPLNERLDPDRNYLILLSAFWCLPCVRQIDNHLSQNIKLYRDLYNLEIIILNDDYYDDTHIALDKIRDKQWYFDQFMTDDLFSSLGINAIPRDYFIPAGETVGERVFASSFLRDIEAYHVQDGYESVFFHTQTQVIANENCEITKTVPYGLSESAVYNDTTYHAVGDYFYRSGVLNKNIYRYDPLIDNETLVFDYYLNQCDEFDLVDIEGDRLTVSVNERSVIDDEITIVTDAIMGSACGDEYPLILSSTYGSNAGFAFDIENGEIVSHLVCHTTDGEEVYTSPDIGDLCEPLSSQDLSALTAASLSNNPGDGRFAIHTPDQVAEVKYQVFSTDGTLIYQKEDNGSTTIDLSDSPAGVYTVVFTINGTRGSLLYSLVP